MDNYYKSYAYNISAILGWINLFVQSYFFREFVNELPLRGSSFDALAWMFIIAFACNLVFLFLSIIVIILEYILKTSFVNSENNVFFKRFKSLIIYKLFFFIGLFCLVLPLIIWAIIIIKF